MNEENQDHLNENIPSQEDPSQERPIHEELSEEVSPLEEKMDTQPIATQNRFSPAPPSFIVKKMEQLEAECSKILIGQSELVRLMLTCIFSDGHILLEGVPGIAKTLSAKVLAKTVDAGFSRIQFTPDLLPSDILGTSVFNMKDAVFNFIKGPIFSNVVLIDEINRAPAKTQSALFEVMEEKQISYDGEQYKMGFPFLIIATQNPIEQEGTYRLPEAQLDRFLMKINLEYPSEQEEFQILNRFKASSGTMDLSKLQAILSSDDIVQIQKELEQLHVEDQMLQYIASLVHETRNHAKIYLGGSPRASLGILKTAKVSALLEGRNFIIPDDIQYVAPHVLNHRIILTSDAEMEGLTTNEIIKEILQTVEVPR